MTNVKRMPMPKEGCTEEEKVAYLANHIEALQEQLGASEERYNNAADAKDTRAWCLDRAVRYAEQRPSLTHDVVIDIAKAFNEYVKIEKVEE